MKKVTDHRGSLHLSASCPGSILHALIITKEGCPEVRYGHSALITSTGLVRLALPGDPRSPWIGNFKAIQITEVLK